MANEIVIPEGIVRAADEAISKARGFRRDITGGEVRDVTLKAALEWLSKDPIAPTLNQIREIESAAAHESYGSTAWISDILEEWQRLMFRHV